MGISPNSFQPPPKCRGVEVGWHWGRREGNTLLHFLLMSRLRFLTYTQYDVVKDCSEKEGRNKEECSCPLSLGENKLLTCFLCFYLLLDVVGSSRTTAIITVVSNCGQFLCLVLPSLLLCPKQFSSQS